MKTFNNLYEKIISLDNLFLAYQKARKGKTKKLYVLEFASDLQNNLLKLHEELKTQTYTPEPLKTFILRDPKTRKISVSAFRDRIVHHSIIRIIEPIFDKRFIHDSCANRKGKGTLFALKRFELFKRKVANNLKLEAFCFKADIKHYFQEVSHKILINILENKIKDEPLIELIRKILSNGQVKAGIGMPLGNLTSQFFANVYLGKLDYFTKHVLKAKYYIRYVDDFVILNQSREQLEKLKRKIQIFLGYFLKLELHPQKSRIISLSRGVDFVGFRNYWHHKLLRKRNIRKMLLIIEKYKKGELSKEKLLEIFQGWQAYAKWANACKLKRKIVKMICSRNSN